MENVIPVIIGATKEVFETMVFLNPEPVENLGVRELISSKITGMIGIAGNYSGVLTFHCDKDTAMFITANMLGIEPSAVNPDTDIRDAIGEITNMIAGNVKTKTCTPGDSFELSIPTVIAGNNFSIGILADSPSYVVPFKLGDNEVYVELIIQKV